MKMRRSASHRPRLSRDASRMLAAAEGLAASGSRTEDQYWELLLMQGLGRMLDARHDEHISTLLESLDPRGLPYEGVIDILQSLTECVEIENAGETWQALLIGVPVIARSRYEIPSGALRETQIESLTGHVRTLIAASSARLILAPVLYSPDQFPATPVALRELTMALGRQSLGLPAQPGHPEAAELPTSAPMLADARFVLGVLVVPRGAPHFLWQEHESSRPRSREDVLKAWRTAAQPDLAPLLTGCELDLLLPDAYHGCRREADTRIRPHSLSASIDFIASALNTEPPQVQAILAPFGDPDIEEYRVGFMIPGHADIVHGVVWPLFGGELGPEPGGPLDQIEAQLREAGLTRIVILEERFMPEYCDDCGTPLFADAQGDVMHPELPEDASVPNTHLH